MPSASDASERLRALLSYLPGMAYRCADDESWTIELASDGCLALTGHPAADLMASRITWQQIIHPDDRERVRREVHAGLRAKGTFQVVYRIVRADGEVRWVDERGGARTGPHEGHLDGFIMDASDQAAREEKLRRSEALLVASQRMAHVGSWYADETTGTVEWSAEMFRIHGVEPPVVPSLDEALFRLVHPDDGPAFREQLVATILAGGEAALRYRIVRPDGDIRHIQGVLHVTRSAAGTSILGTAQDVTAQLREDEGKTFLVGFADVLASSLEPLALLDAAAAYAVPRLGDVCVITWLHPGGVERRLAFAPGVERSRLEALARRLAPVEPIAERLLRGESLLVESLDDARIAALFSDPEQAAAMKATGLRSLLAVPLLHGNVVVGALTFLVTESDRSLDAFDRDLARDLAARLALAHDNARLYDEARRSRAELEEAQRIGRVGSWNWDPVHRRSTVSAEVVRALGIGPTLEDPLAAILARVSPDDSERLREDVRRILRTGRPTFEAEYRILGAGGDARAFLVRSEWVFDGDGRCVRASGAAQDVTEQRELEAQLRQAQKMEAVGRLAGGIAHDFNNLLTVIAATTGFLLEDCPEGDPRREDVLVVEGAAERAAALTRRLLTFSRRDVVRPRLLDVAELIDGTATMLRRMIGEDIALHVSCAPDVPRVLADAPALEQAIANLVVNARDAMPDGGRIELAASACLLDAEGAARRPGLSPGLHAKITVADTGHGIDERTRARIFEPFFTTKEPGKGTGLGLSTVFGIVEQAQGHIGVETAVGRGTTFTMLLRAADPAPAERPVPARSLPPPAASSRAARETVLVLEDDDDVRRIARRALENDGYRVLEAGTVRAAIELAEGWSETIDLVLSDVVLPDGSGRTAVEQIERRHLGIAVLFMSGYASDALVRHRIAERGAAFVEKPFTVERLVAMVRATLDVSRATRTTRD